MSHFELDFAPIPGNENARETREDAHSPWAPRSGHSSTEYNLSKEGSTNE